MRKTILLCCLGFLCFSEILLAGGYAADLTFWKPLQPSSGTLLLLNFDQKEMLLQDYSPDKAKVELFGKALTVPGKFGYGLALEDGLVKISLSRPVAFEFSWMSPSPQFSGQAWVFLSQYPEKEVTIFERPFIPRRQNYWSLTIQPNGAAVMRWRRHEGLQKEMVVSTNPRTVPIGQWFHLAGLFRHGHHAAIYLNGEEKGTTLFLSKWQLNEAPAVEKDPGVIYLGNSEKGDSLFPGYLDEVRLSTDVIYFFSRPDNSWCDVEKTKSVLIGPPYTPAEEEILLHVDAENPDLVRLTRKKDMKPVFTKNLPVSLIPGVSGKGFTGAVSFPQEDILNRAEGALEFWFAPINWSNGQSFHLGIFGGPFSIYVFNTGVVQAPWVPVVAYFPDRSNFPFHGLFSPEKWEHLVVCWEKDEITTYHNGDFSHRGRLAGGNFNQVAGRWPLSFNQYATTNWYDEIFVYNRSLSPQEVSNCYWRYKDQSRLKPLLPVEAEISYLQGSNLICFRIVRGNQLASQFQVEVKKRNGQVLYSGKIKNFSGQDWETEKLPHLVEGEYLASVKFFSKKNQEASRQEKAFTVKHFPWEGNNIGKEPIIIPPYQPLTVAGNKISLWGRNFTLGKNGLPESLVSQGQEILARPINLVAETEQGEISLQGERIILKDIPGFKVVNQLDYLKGPLTGAIPPLELTQSSGYQVKVFSAGALGKVKVELSGWVDFDGWYQFKVALKPEKEPVKLQSLALVIPFFSQADTLYAQVLDRSLDPNGYVNSSGEFGGIAKKEGWSWNSLILKRKERWKSFVPQVFVGTGDVGLWWLAESAEGWVLADDVPCVTVTRYPEEVRLTLKIIGSPVVLTGQRVFESALLPGPVKPMVSRWREIGWMRGKSTKNYYSHDTSGYRYWGDSVDSFSLPSEDDYRKLGAFLQNPAKVNPYYSWYPSQGVKDGVPHVLYGSTWMTGLGMEEFKYYGREWLGDENWKPLPDLTFEGEPNYGNTCRWLTPEQLTPRGVNFNSSFIDCFIWYHQLLLKNCPVNGTWWDNSSIGLITEYLPDKGPVEIWNTFKRRELTRRLAVMSYLVGRRPWWLQNMHVDFSWCQVGWHIENDFYIQGKAKDLIDQLGIDKFRALTRTKGGLLPQLHSNMPEQFTLEEKIQAARTIIGLSLLHDIGQRGLVDYKQPFKELLEKTVDRMEAEIGFFSEEVVFLPYWRQKVLSLPENVYASFFSNRGKAVAVIVNAGEDEVRLSSLLFNVSSLGLRKVTQIGDLETGQLLATVSDSSSPGIDRLILKRHQVLFLLLQ
ncbi:MAG: LamG domain-containing protein [Candidatus Omnitrophica bacterium]|nr:LamG domain-containing protein [Candidatus Omnitrophota bacterium]